MVSVHAGSDTRVGLIEALRIYREDLRFIELVHRTNRGIDVHGCTGRKMAGETMAKHGGLFFECRL